MTHDFLTSGWATPNYCALYSAVLNISTLPITCVRNLPKTCYILICRTLLFTGTKGHLLQKDQALGLPFRLTREHLCAKSGCIWKQNNAKKLNSSPTYALIFNTTGPSQTNLLSFHTLLVPVWIQIARHRFTTINKIKNFSDDKVSGQSMFCSSNSSCSDFSEQIAVLQNNSFIPTVNHYLICAILQGKQIRGKWTPEFEDWDLLAVQPEQTVAFQLYHFSDPSIWNVWPNCNLCSLLVLYDIALWNYVGRKSSF